MTHTFHCRSCLQDFDSIIHPWLSAKPECRLCGIREVDGEPAVVARPMSLPEKEKTK